MAVWLSQCCDEDCAAPCPYHKVCGMDGDRSTIEYISVGNAVKPTYYPGTYWAAWHNSISKRGKITVDIELVITKRTMVQENCGDTCPACSGLSTSADCRASGTVSAAALCKRNVYTDNVIWNASGVLGLVGGAPEQTRQTTGGGTVYYDDMAGTIPCGIGYPCDSCATGMNTAIAAAGRTWWAYENRKLIPRFSGTSTVIEASAIPSSSYPITAACGSLVRTNRCSTGTTTYNAPVCIDYPIIILPSLGGTKCDATASACDPTTPENGADNALWGFDIVSQDLYDRLNALGMPTDTGIGTWNDFWCVKTAGRFRMLFDLRPLLASAGSVYKPKDGRSGLVKTAILDLGCETYRVDARVTITTQDWCYVDKDCECHKSWCEFGNPTISLRADIPMDNSTACAAPSTVELSMNLGLESCYRPYGSAGWNECFAWNALPNATPYGGEPSWIRDNYRYLGSTPVERGHPFWQKWRNRYNHTETVNNWWTYSATNNMVFCPPIRSGTSTKLPDGLEFYVEPFEGIKCDNAARTALCQSVDPTYVPCCQCVTPVSPVSYYPAGCYEAKRSVYNFCDNCDPLCDGCIGYAGIFSGTGGLPGCVDGCATMSQPLEATIPCQAYAGCKGDDDFDYTMVIHVCASQSYTICDMVANSGTSPVTRSIGAFNTWIWKWNPYENCTPAGTHTLLAVSDLSVCDGPSSWGGLAATTISVS